MSNMYKILCILCIFYHFKLNIIRFLTAIKMKQNI